MRNKSLIAAGLALGAGGYLVARATPRSVPRSGPSVLILGAGFGGLAAAEKLSSLACRRARITVLDRHNYQLFTPLVYQAATCGIVPYDAALPIRQWTTSQGILFRQATVAAIDLQARAVRLEGGEQVGYDYLVVALGTTTNFFGNRSAREHAYPLKTMEDGIAIRNHILDTLEQAAATNDYRRRGELLTYVVVGGGATGVETAGAIAALLTRLIPRNYPVLRGARWRVLVLESECKLLGHMSDEMAKIALRELKSGGVEVRLSTRAEQVTAEDVKTGAGEVIRTRTVIWATGVRVPDVVSHLDAEHSHGGSVTVNEFLQVKGHPEAYAIGDNAHFVDPRSHKPVPLLAATAMQQGKAAAANIARALRARPQRPFHYRNLGNVVSVGQRSGVAEIGGRIISGFAGWLAWRVVHLARLTSTRNQLATALDWTVGYFYEGDTARLDVQPRPKAA